MKRFIAILSAGLLSGGTSLARTASGTLTTRIAPPAGKSQNTMTLSDASGRGETNYPLQFGRPFLRGAVPPGKCPVVSAGSVALPTQADVKNRYPDGSAEFAVVAVVVPHVPAHGLVRLRFTPGACNNTPLTQAQMLDASYNFDAQTQLTYGVTATPAKLDSGLSSPSSYQIWHAITNGGFSITVNGVVQHVTGINFSTLVSNFSNFWTLVNSGLAPYGLVGHQTDSAHVEIDTIATGASATLSYASAPIYGGQDISAYLGIRQSQGGTTTKGHGGSSGNTAKASARMMLANGDYKLWTSGPVAQTIILADDTPTRKYDLNVKGDGYHPFRPRFTATFWPATHQVFVRAIGEAGLSTELEDLSYGLTITGGQTSPATEENDPSVNQGAASTWTRTFWLGGAPQVEVNIDNNLKYLEGTRFVENYDPSITLSSWTIATDYANYYTNVGHDIGGSGAWLPGMPTTGQSDMIAPEPGWDVAWLYSGDWRLRQAALAETDLAAAWPVNVRETDPNAILNRGDAAGTGYGKPISITYRKWVGPSLGGFGEFLTYNSDVSNPPNSLKIVGPVNMAPAWDFDSAHEPSPWFIPYVLTGDPFYLDELKMWAAYDATSNPGGPGVGVQNSRGPTGEEGGAFSQLRGDAWILRSRAEAAFAMPDSDPFKKYLTILTQEFLARWDGSLGVADPNLSGFAEYAWGQQTGDPHTSTEWGTPSPAPTLHEWEAEPISDGKYNQQYWVSGTGITEPWMQWFTQWALGRATELGFAAGPLTVSTGSFLSGIVNSTGYPKLVGAYFLPTWTASGQLTSWQQFVANLDQRWLTGVNYTGGATGGPLPQFFAGAAWGTNNYDIMASAAMASLVDEDAPGAAQAQTWLQANVYQPQFSQLSVSPLWAIVPRTDHNVLPAQSTADPAP